jgi:hypothetical protein
MIPLQSTTVNGRQSHPNPLLFMVLPGTQRPFELMGPAPAPLEPVVES